MPALFELERQGTMLDEGHQEIGAVLDRPCAGSGRVGQFVDVGDYEVDQEIH